MIANKLVLSVISAAVLSLLYWSYDRPVEMETNADLSINTTAIDKKNEVSKTSLPAPKSRNLPGTQQLTKTNNSFTVEVAESSEPNISALDIAPISVTAFGEEMNYSSLENTVNDSNDSPEPIVGQLNDRFASEPFDYVWANEAEATLQQRFLSAGLQQSQLDEATCRATMCRITVTHSDIIAEQRFLAEMSAMGEFTSDGERGYFLREIDYNGMPHTIFFLSRPGYTLSGSKS